MSTELFITQALEICGLMVWSLGVTIILIGVIKSLKTYLTVEFGKHTHTLDIDSVRYKLGTYLLLGLEFLVAADILETVFAPTLEKIGILGGIVIIRTVLNFFLNKELERIERKEAE